MYISVFKNQKKKKKTVSVLVFSLSIHSCTMARTKRVARHTSAHSAAQGNRKTVPGSAKKHRTTEANMLSKFLKWRSLQTNQHFDPNLIIEFIHHLNSSATSKTGNGRRVHTVGCTNRLTCTTCPRQLKHSSLKEYLRLLSCNRKAPLALSAALKSPQVKDHLKHIQVVQEEGGIRKRMAPSITGDDWETILGGIQAKRDNALLDKDGVSAIRYAQLAVFAPAQRHSGSRPKELAKAQSRNTVYSTDFGVKVLNFNLVNRKVAASEHNIAVPTASFCCPLTAFSKLLSTSKQHGITIGVPRPNEDFSPYIFPKVKRATNGTVIPDKTPQGEWQPVCVSDLNVLLKNVIKDEGLEHTLSGFSLGDMRSSTALAVAESVDDDAEYNKRMGWAEFSQMGLRYTRAKNLQSFARLKRANASTAHAAQNRNYSNVF